MKNHLTPNFVLFSLAFSLFTVLASEGWRPVNPLYEWNFPRDHWAKRGYKTEWWYLTGHLASESEERRRFGYQFTFFRIGISPNPLPFDSEWASEHMIMGHAAVSDLQEKEHWFSETLYRESPIFGEFPDFPDPVIAWSLAPPGTEGKWSLRWNGDGFDIRAVDRSQGLSIQLETRPLKPLLFQGPGGISPKSKTPTSASLYYSFTRMNTIGSLEVAGRSYSVVGQSWMDKEFSSNILSDNQVGWDWFCLRLFDGRELMLFKLRDRQGQAAFSWATLASVEGEATYLQDSQWSLQEVDSWQSPGGAVYPSRWTLTLPENSMVLDITSAFPDQENRSQLIPNLDYWEGVVEVVGSDGEKAGEGYAELTGYNPSGRLPL